MHNLQPSFRRWLYLPLLAAVAVLIALLPGTDSVALAGAGTTTTVPYSSAAPTMDGQCTSAEYADAQIVKYSVSGFDYDVYLKRTVDDLWVCYPRTPLPNGGASFVSVYIDLDNDGGDNDADDFVVSMPFAFDGAPRAGYWNSATGAYDGPDPGGWAAEKWRTGGEFPSWSNEFRISRLVLGGWKQSVGLALFYHWWRFTGDDYSWPANGIWANPQLWGNARFVTGNIDIGRTTNIPSVDGRCSSGEYSDASTATFQTNAIFFNTVTAYFKHSDTDLYVCLASLAVPNAAVQDGPNAVVYLNRAGAGGNLPGADDIALTISYNGTVRVNRGGGGAYTGPDPGGHTIQRAKYTRNLLPPFGPEISVWDAEFRISSSTLGSGWDRDICITVAQQWVQFVGNDFGWPQGFRWNYPNTWGIGRLTTAASSPSADLRVTNVEVTQAIQDLSNSVVLVNDKRTFVRAHVGTNQAKNGVQARLYGSRNGVNLGFPLQPLNPGAVVNMGLAPNRANINDSFYFELPWYWINGSNLTVRAELNPFHDIAESNYANNVRSATVNFVATKPLRLRTVNFQYRQSNGTLISAANQDIALLESQARRMYPISQLITSRRTFFDGSITTTPDAGYVNSCLQWSRNTYDGGAPGWKYYGLVADAGGFMRGNSGSIPSGQASGPAGVPGVNANPAGASGWDTDGTYADWYGTHELGHTLERYHAEFCGAGGGRSYPYPNGIIGGPSTNMTRYFGFDAGDAGAGITTRVVPNTWTDNMSYCASEWISDFTYTGIRTYIQNNLPSVQAAAMPAVSGDFLSVYGMIDLAEQSAQLPFVSRQREVAELPPLVAGPFHIRLLDAGNSVLADYPFTPTGEGGDQDNVRLIQQIVDWQPGTRRIAIYADEAGRVIGSKAVSANPPSVTIDARSGGTNLPATGPVVLEWTGSDPDNDALEYTILYSFDDRTTWRTLATMIMADEFSLDAGELESTGGAQSGWLRVVVNDGVLTSSADSGPFSVENKAPVAVIVSPADGGVYGYGQTVALEGYGQDFEDGTLPDGKLSWQSSLDGALGTGHLLHPDLLTEGEHVVTLTVTDSAGKQAAASVTIKIGDLPPVAQKALDPGQTSMIFLDEAGGVVPTSQPLSLRNQEGSVLNWTVTADKRWIGVDKGSGATSDEVGVTVDTGGFVQGSVHIGHLTFTADGAVNSPLQVAVVVQMVGDPISQSYLPYVTKP